MLSFKTLALAAALPLLSLATVHAGANPVPDQYCQKFKETGAVRGTVNVTIQGQACVMKTPPKQFCTRLGFSLPTVATPVDVLPAGASYACYKVKCPKQNADAAVLDRFGSHQGTVKAPSIACFQAEIP